MWDLTSALNLDDKNKKRPRIVRDQKGKPLPQTPQPVNEQPAFNVADALKNPTYQPIADDIQPSFQREQPEQQQPINNPFSAIDFSKALPKQPLSNPYPVELIANQGNPEPKPANFDVASALNPPKFKQPIDIARDNYQKAVTEEKPKVNTWANGLWLALQGANKYFNPNDQSEIQTIGQIAKSSNIQNAGQKLQGLQAIENQKQADEDRVINNDYRKAQIDVTKQKPVIEERKTNIAEFRAAANAKYQEDRLTLGRDVAEKNAKYRDALIRIGDAKLEQGDKRIDILVEGLKDKDLDRESKEKIANVLAENRIDVANILSGSREKIANMQEQGRNKRYSINIENQQKQFNQLMELRKQAFDANNQKALADIDTRIKTAKSKAKEAGLTDEDYRAIFGEN